MDPLSKSTEQMIEDFYWFRKYDRANLRAKLYRERTRRFVQFIKRINKGERITFNYSKYVVNETR